MTDLTSTHPAFLRTADRPIARDAPLAPWLLIGIGLGGLIDGIVFHEILQWHSTLSQAVPPTDIDRIRFNMLADGVFHGAAWIVTVLGLLLLWQSVRSGRSNTESAGAFGTLLGGLGIFNLAEGIINHHLLGLHNVREVADPTPWNLGFLVVGGIVPLALGALLRQRATHRRVYRSFTAPTFEEPAIVTPDPPTRAVPDTEPVRPLPRPMQVVQLLLPLGTRSGQPIDPRAFDTVKNELTERFGGITAYTRSPAEGRWLGRTRREYDDIVVFEVMVSDFDPDWWNDYRRRLEASFDQQSIVVRAAPAQVL